MGTQLNHHLMTCQQAEHCFWLFRHLARADILVHILSAYHFSSLDGRVSQLQNLRNSFLSKLSAEEDPYEADLEFNLVWLATSPNSLIANITEARRHANAIRDVMSEKLWQLINDLQHWLNKKSTKKMFLFERALFYNHLQEILQMFLGYHYNHAFKDQLFYFMEFGFLWERMQRILITIKTISTDQAQIKTISHEESLLYCLFILKSLALDECYLKLNTHLEISQINSFLFNEARAQCSIRYCLQKMQESLVAIIGHPHKTPSILVDSMLLSLTNTKTHHLKKHISIANTLLNYLDELAIEIKYYYLPNNTQPPVGRSYE